MKLDGFTANDICKIIKQCAQAGVSKFGIQSGQLTVEFSQKANLTNSYTPEKANQEGLVVFPEGDAVESEKLAEDASILTEGSFVDEDLDNLQITDPYRYEELLSTEGALESAKEETG